MKKSKIPTKLQAPWLAYTDLLGSTVLILSIVVVATLLSKLSNEKPPIIRLSDAKDYRFSRGSFNVSEKFKNKLRAEELPKIERAIKCYAIDTIEIVGHTDKSPNSGLSNLDQFQDIQSLEKKLSKVNAGSNADLGLLRAIAVQSFLEKIIKNEGNKLVFKSYSASSFIEPYSRLEKAKDREKRRIEIRLTRVGKDSTVRRC